MKIALYGIGGVYNYGCEAIVRGTEEILKDYAQVDYISYRPEDDKKRLAGSGVSFVPLFHSNRQKFIYKCLCKIENLAEKILKKRTFWLSNSYLHRWVLKYDVILSIGGDIYTLPPDIQQNPKQKNALVEFGYFVKSKHKKLVVWGASVGPFDDYPFQKDYFINHFNQCVDFVVAREERTVKYLKQNGYDRVKLFADPAFVLDKIPTEQKNIKVSDKLRIGVNLSELSNQYLFDDGKKPIDVQCKLLEMLINKFNSEIILIPHVLSQSDVDNDYVYLKSVQQQMKQLGYDVWLIENDPGFLGTKEELCKCDVVISARMHCAINAICCGVPTLMLSYSDKTIGMSKFVYGNESFALSLKSTEDISSAIEKINFIINNKKIIENYLKNNRETWKEQTKLAAQYFKIGIEGNN